MLGEYFIFGLDDGTVHAFHYGKNKGQSYNRSTTKNKSVASYDQFCDSTYTHQETIVSVEKNPNKDNVFLSASKDGLVTVWSLETEKSEGEQVEPEINDFKVSDTGLMKFQEEIDFKQAVTSVKWLSEKIIVASTTRGQVLVHEFDQSEKRVYAKKCLYEAEGAAIWDLKVWSEAPGKSHIYVAEDSGRVVVINAETLATNEVFVSTISPVSPFII